MIVDPAKVKALIELQDLDVSGLAKNAGLSRGAIYGVLRNGKRRIRTETVRRIAAALHVAPEELSAGGVLACYHQWAVDQHACLDFHGMGLGHLSRRSLGDLYVPERLALLPDPEPGDCGEHGVRRVLQDSYDGRRELELEAAAQRYHRMVVLGEPGSGKTTLLRRFAAELARNRSDSVPGSKPVQVPLFIPLAEFSRAKEGANELDPVAFLSAEVRRDGGPDPEVALRESLEMGCCVVFLDGLDEVAITQSVTALCRCLASFVRKYPANRYVLTSRRVGFDAQPWRRIGFNMLRVQPWKENQIHRFVENWFHADTQGGSARSREDAHTMAGRLVQLIISEPRIHTIATNPLMLVILAVLHRGHAVLPRRRADLYAKIADTLLESWEAAKMSARPGDVLHGTLLEAREYRWLLAHVAFEMQRNNFTLAARWWLAEKVQEFLCDQLGLDLSQARREGERVLRYLCERAGLLVERGRDSFAFWHLTFQEFFAAQASLQQAATPGRPGLTELLRPYFYHPRWSEVVRLVASQLAPPQVPALLRSILDDPDPLGRFLQRGPLLCLACLAEGAVPAEGRLVDEIFESVEGFGESHWLGMTLEALSLLQEFRGTRFAARATATTYRILTLAKERLDENEYQQLRIASDTDAQPEIAGVPDIPRFGDLVSFKFAGVVGKSYFLDRQRMADDPKSWHADAADLLRSKRADDALKLSIINEMSETALAVSTSREALLKLLRGRGHRELRAAAAWALSSVATSDVRVAGALVERLRDDHDESVREACACALKEAASRDEAIREQLLETLRSDAPTGVRRGAAYGLKLAANRDPVTRDFLQELAQSSTADERIRVACLWALSSSVGVYDDVRSLFIELVTNDRSAKVKHAAAHGIVPALVKGEISWDRPLVGCVETVLTGLERPCCHALEALRELAAARELRAGLRLDRVLSEALRMAGADVVLVFIFGSTARMAQTPQSDVDLFVVGRASLKQIAGPLSRAEQTLGRRVNPVIYSEDELVEKYRTGHPFVQDVLQREKIFLKGTEHELRTLVARTEVAHAARTDDR